MNPLITLSATVLLTAIPTMSQPNHKPSYTITESTSHHESWLRFEGAMTMKGMSDLGDKIVAGNYDRLELNSAGGLAQSGYLLGHAIEYSNVKVMVRYGDICLSACAFAAMGSDDVIINGILGLHSPYAMGHDSGTTLTEIAQISNVGFADMMWYLSNMGYNIRLLKQIADETSPESFIVFSNAADLKSFKTDSFLNDTKEYMTMYEVMSTDDIREYLQNKE